MPDARTAPRVRLAVAAALLLGTVVLYWPATRADFVNFDDPDYVTANAVVREGLTLGGARWAFAGFRLQNWHPLSLLSHMADVQLYGLQPRGHHLTSVLLHAAGAVLLLTVLYRCTGAFWRSALVAALFAAHPVHVESVAWVSERKDVLSTLFWMIGLAAYLGYVRRPGTARYLIVAACLGAGLMAKAMLVTFPLTLLLLDFWPLGRAGFPPAPGGIGRSPGGRLLALASEKAPLFALAAASAGLTVLAQRSGGALATIEEYPLGVRLQNALISYVSYLGKALWPRDLAVIYPHPGAGVSALKAAAAAALLATISVAVFRLARRRPVLVTGWLWYVVTLVPVIGLVQVGAQAMADRYTYVPLTGVFLAAVWTAADATRGRLRVGMALGAGLLAAVAALVPMTRAQTATWGDGVGLFTHALRVTGGNASIRNNLGTALASRGRLPEALPHLSEAVRLEPGNARYQFNLATALVASDRVDDALPAFRRAIELRPGYDEARANYAVALARSGRLRESVEQFEEVLRASPRNERVHFNLGLVLKAAGRPAEAAAHFRSALEIAPGFDAARRELGAAGAGGRTP